MVVLNGPDSGNTGGTGAAGRGGSVVDVDEGYGCCDGSAETGGASPPPPAGHQDELAAWVGCGSTSPSITPSASFT